MIHKNDYSAVVFFDNTTTKKWTYVHNIDSFVQFLDKEHPSWEYLNLYERRTRKFLKRFYKGASIPKHV